MVQYLVLQYLFVKEVSNINLDLENNKKNKDSISREIDIKIKTSK